MSLETLPIAQDICAKNPKLVEFIQENEENYSPVRKQVNKIAQHLSQKYADGAYITKTDLHQLTWDIINVANGDENEELAISI